MSDHGSYRRTSAPWDDNQGRAVRHLPGTSTPARGPLPLAYTYQPAPSPTQSGRARTKEWLLEFEPSAPYEIEPLMGWIGSRDPFKHIQLRFPDRQSAIDFAERHGWPYVVQDPPVRRFRPKSYADNFRYDLAAAISRAQDSWDGTVTIGDGENSPEAFTRANAAAPMGLPARGAGGQGRTTAIS